VRRGQRRIGHRLGRPAGVGLALRAAHGDFHQLGDALAVAHQKPIYVTRALFDQVEDMSAVLEQAQRDAEAAENEDDETEESDEEEEEE
jgi:hypothetical protein